MTAKEIFKVGNHGITWVDTDFTSRYGNEEVEEGETVPEFKKLGKAMYDREIETELKPSKATLGHILALIKNPPEGTKDGWSNIFYIGEFVVGVSWRDDGWGAWVRGDAVALTGMAVVVSSPPLLVLFPLKLSPLIL